MTACQPIHADASGPRFDGDRRWSAMLNVGFEVRDEAGLMRPRLGGAHPSRARAPNVARLCLGLAGKSARRDGPGQQENAQRTPFRLHQPLGRRGAGRDHLFNSWAGHAARATL